jgi:hypothetical protein
MKNIHIFWTNKPSKLVFNKHDKCLELSDFERSPTKLKSNRYVYITSDEEIKEGDSVIHIGNKTIFKYTKGKNESWKKIILTTDPKLINDGVQALDNNFLQWFVRNPSCEFVETKLVNFEVDMDLGDNCIEHGSYYRIIIPQEEPKQIKCYCGHTITCDCGPLEEPKQETIEEVDENKKNLHYYKQVMNPYPVGEYSYTAYEKGFIEGYQESTKLQAERMYNEAIDFAEWIRIKNFQTASKNNWIGLDMKYYTTQELFKQFKKK